MPTARRREAGDLTRAFSRWLAARLPAAAGRAVVSADHASEGWSNETLLVRLAPQGPGDVPGYVVRLPPLLSSFPDEDLAREAAVLQAAARAGIAAPGPVVYEADPAWLGAPFLVVPLVEGTVPGQAPALDRRLREAGPEAQARLHRGFVATLVSIHSVTPTASGLVGTVRSAGRDLADELDWWAAYLEWSGGAGRSGRLVRALDWCRAHRPDAVGPACLLWGDPRPGNLIVDDAWSVRAVLDWELALLGPAELDLGWYLGQDRAMARLIGLEVPGFPERGEWLAGYAAALGRPLGDLAWYEVFGLFRSAAIGDRQAANAARVGAAYLTPPGDDNPLLDVMEEVMATA